MANTLKFGSGQWATKVGSTLAYNDENGNFKPLPFNFTRSTGGTRVNKNGLIEVVTNNKPRIDFLNDSNGALLLEPSRSNLVNYSEDFSNAAWLKSNNPTITSNIAIAPDGTQTANGIQDINGVNLKSVSQSFSVNSNSTATISIFVKKELTNTNFGGLMLYFSGGTVKYVYGIIDEVNGVINIAPQSVIGSSSTKVEDYGTYWRFSLSGTDNGSNNTARFQYYASFSTNGTDVTGNAIGSLRTLWGSQLELGSYATSYRPTQGAIATRVAEVCNNAGNATVFNSLEGVLYINTAALTQSGENRWISIHDNTGNNDVELRYTSNTNQIRCKYVIGSVAIADVFFTVTDATQFSKIAFKWASSDFALWIDGVEVATSLTGATSNVAFDELSFDVSNLGSTNFYGNTKNVRVYNTALTESELIALTT